MRTCVIAPALWSLKVDLPWFLWCSFPFQPTPCNLKAPLVTTKVDGFVTTANSSCPTVSPWHAYGFIMPDAPLLIVIHMVKTMFCWCWTFSYATFAEHECPRVTHHSHVSYPIEDLITKLRGKHSNNIDICQPHGKTHESCFEINW